MINRYNREAATSYATNYAINPNKQFKFFEFVNGNGGDCTNFVSQCLKAGGALMDYNNIRPWWYQSGKASICWGVAHSLYWYLKINQSSNKKTIKGMEVTDIGELELGDLIFYENFRNVIFHSTIITSFTDINGDEEPRISQHSYNQLNETYKKSYDYKKAHFIKIIL